MPVRNRQVKWSGNEFYTPKEEWEARRPVRAAH